MNYIWVVEMRGNKTWKPTIGVGTTRFQARQKMKKWKENNPFDQFRVKKYFWIVPT